jgi:hypothetical protein
MTLLRLRDDFIRVEDMAEHAAVSQRDLVSRASGGISQWPWTSLYEGTSIYDDELCGVGRASPSLLRPSM